MIIEIPNFVSDEEIMLIRSRVQPHIPKVEYTLNSYNREGKTVLISKVPELNDLDSVISNIMIRLQSNVVQNRFKPLFPSADTGYEYHLYEKGQICHYHCDGEVCGFTKSLRYATVILFLTDNDGGELVFPSHNREIKPEAGKIVVFPPYTTYGHYSKPSDTNREIIMTWFIYNGIKITEC
jgi:hypothetical protein